MYLREIFIHNNGPVRSLHLEMAFDEESNSRPLPTVIVGRNGTGKTNLLSIIADALMNGASKAFSDVLTRHGAGRSYFRIVGGSTLTYGESSGFSILRFDDESSELFYHENAGTIGQQEAQAIAPETLAGGIQWSDKQSKNLHISEQRAETVFESGTYAFFPASRSEHPHWFNRESIEGEEFELFENFSQRLRRSMFVEHGINEFTQWLLGVIMESRLAVQSAELEPETVQSVNIRLDTTTYMQTQWPLIWANNILKIILDDRDAQFTWTGRLTPRKIAVVSGGHTLAAGLESLSGGQATLLAIFGTILRYCDLSHKGPGEAEGIVVIDELDAHMHLDLQLDALPKLISQFPMIQFIVSSHSPFFALGLERELTPNGVRIIELPHGRPVNAEAYEEFQRALIAFRDTNQYTEEVRKAVTSGQRPMIIVGGETDLKYFRTAARLLEFPHLEDAFHWIGTPGTSAGGGDFTGDSSLNQAVKFLRANPEFTDRKVVVVYDCDARKTEESFGSVHIVSLDPIPEAECEKGIENLLPSGIIPDEMWDWREIKTGYGKSGTKPELRKMDLCDHLCGNHPDITHFENFRSILNRLSMIVSPPPKDAISAEKSDSAKT